jgi:hemoglobin-like flavoprotein
LTEYQRLVIQQTFQHVKGIPDDAVVLFHARLRQLDPDLHNLFSGDMQERGHDLLHVIGLAVASMRRFDLIAPAVAELGRRHAQYGVHPEHYETFGAALLWTLETILGIAFTPSARKAWADFYDCLAGIMQNAAFIRPQLFIASRGALASLNQR